MSGLFCRDFSTERFQCLGGAGSKAGELELELELVVESFLSLRDILCRVGRATMAMMYDYAGLDLAQADTGNFDRM